MTPGRWEGAEKKGEKSTCRLVQASERWELAGLQTWRKGGGGVGARMERYLGSNGWIISDFRET